MELKSGSSAVGSRGRRDEDDGGLFWRESFFGQVEGGWSSSVDAFSGSKVVDERWKSEWADVLRCEGIFQTFARSLI